MCKFPKLYVCFRGVQSTLCAAQRLFLKVKKPFQERKKERNKERKKEGIEERRILRLKVIFVHEISKWPVSMLTKGYDCQFSTAVLRSQ